MKTECSRIEPILKEYKFCVKNQIGTQLIEDTENIEVYV